MIADTQLLASAIVDDLMTNGRGQKAVRLVLELSDETDGGGWSREALVSRIAHWIKHEEKP
jgi:hypothetical protein